MARERLLSLVLVLPVFLLLLLLFGGNYWNGDRDAYELYYERETLASWGIEFGYGYLNLVSKNIGLEYQVFQVIVSVITIALYLRYFIKSSYAPFASFLLYALVFFPLDYVLMRQSLAFAIALQAFLVFLNGSSNARVRFIILILLAASIHQSVFLFLIFCFMPLGKVVSLGRFLPIFIIVVFLYIFLRFNAPLPSFVQSHFDLYSISLKSAFSNVIFHILSVALVFLSVLIEKPEALKIYANAGRNKELVFILNLNLFSCFWLIFYFEAEIFVRLLRCLVFFNIFFAISSLSLRLKSTFLNAFAVAMWSLYLVGYFLLPVLDMSVVPLFDKNVIFDLF